MNFSSLINYFSLYIRKTIRLVDNLSFKERIIFWPLFWVGLISLSVFVMFLGDKFLVSIPRAGGSFTEGIVGRPGFINPVLALSDTDKDLVQLVYSGLVRRAPNGEFIPDLAKDVSVSSDGLIYTITLKEDLSWHDGKPLTARDVLFTIQKIQDPLLKSPLQASWDGVETEILNDNTITFSIDNSYALFFDNLTVGILPEHIWNNFATEDFNNNLFNTEPVGSGPYKIKHIKRDRAGLVKEYELSSFPNFSLGEPYIKTIRLKFFSDEDAALSALESNDVDSLSSIKPEDTKNLSREILKQFPLARTFAVFLNQNKVKMFADKSVREALYAGIDRKKIIDTVLFGFGSPLFEPLPEGSFGHQKIISQKSKIDTKNILTENGWELNENGIFEKKREELSFTLATANIPELKAIAEEIAHQWQEVGVKATVKIFEIGDLNQEIIRPREFNALLFGEITGRDPDPFAFWHSSQRLDPGLNIALYTNISADKLLEEIRTTQEREKRLSVYKAFTKEVEKDLPALFIYSPYYLYKTPEQIKNISPFPITLGSERFINIYEWYINTDTVWKIFL
jgi:peptide/nickel transport system substrate-binding protein